MTYARRTLYTSPRLFPTRQLLATARWVCCGGHHPAMFNPSNYPTQTAQNHSLIHSKVAQRICGWQVLQPNAHSQRAWLFKGFDEKKNRGLNGKPSQIHRMTVILPHNFGHGLTVCLPVHPSVRLSVCVASYLPLCLSTRLPVWRPLFLSV